MRQPVDHSSREAAADQHRNQASAMKKTLLIHIGWHKTATTVIQSYLARHRKQLVRYGVCYPVIEVRSVYGRIKHCDFYASIVNELSPGGKKYDVGPFDELFHRSLKEIRASGCPWAIISDEGFSAPNPGIAQRMARYRDHFDEIKIVAYLRRQDLFLESFYAQIIRQEVSRAGAPFDKFMQRPDTRKRLDYAMVLDWWADEFGGESIVVAPFEPHIMVPDPVTHFFHLTGLPAAALDTLPVAATKHNISPPREITELYRYMNLKGADFHENVLTEYLLESEAPLTDTKYLSLADRRKILENYREGNEKIARTYLHREDGILFEEPVREYPNCAETWTGLKPYEVLNYAMPAIGGMSREIARLRNENQRIGSVRKEIYRFLLKLYGKLTITK